MRSVLALLAPRGMPQAARLRRRQRTPGWPTRSRCSRIWGSGWHRPRRRRMRSGAALLAGLVTARRAVEAVTSDLACGRLHGVEIGAE